MRRGVNVSRHGAYRASMNLEQLFSQNLSRSADERPFDTQQLPSCGGVYAFADASGAIIQLSSAENLRRAVAFRLYPPADPTKRPRTDLLEITSRVWWKPTRSQFETFLEFHEIAYRLYAGRHRKMCAFGPSWFAGITLNDRFPRWLAANDPFASESACVGPFATRRKCEEFVKQIEDLFSLCRYHDILEQTPRGEACAYFEMQRCPAPCNGTIPFDQYREALAGSVDFVLGAKDPLRSRLRRQMKAASDDLDFERANRAKQDLDTAEALATLLARMHRRIGDFRYLIVQRAGGRTHVNAFVVNQGDIQQTEPAKLKELEDVAPRWLERVGQAAAPARADATFAAERIWLVSHFLQKRDRTPGLYIHHSELPDALKLADLIRRTFSPNVKTGPPGR